MCQETIFTAYQRIQEAWNNNVSMSDIYHMIVDWIVIWKPEKQFPELTELVHEYLQIYKNSQKRYELVFEFIYGERYKPIRNILIK